MIAVLAAGGATAQTDDARLSPVRRTTIMTADPDASLRFYRDLLGFTVEYDVTVTDPGQLSLISPGATRGRSIALRQGARLGGSIGLSWTDNLQPGAGACEKTGRAGAVGILILTDNLAALHRTVKAAGVPFLADDVRYDQSRGPTDAFTVFDPNCVRVAFAQIQRESFEQSLEK
ncbi:MAG: VOC family protein [Rhodospirillaceae bacterium]|nr:VOC family protein [Rhodospirillaceae bacterium]